MIPRTITQTWRTTRLPEAAARLAEGWRRRHPAFAWRLFDDAACEAVVAEVAPEHLGLYRAFPHPVMRADFFRYAVILRDGGVYADLDMECVRPLEPLLDLAPAVFSVEARLTSRRQRELGYAAPFQIANCIFAAAPGHPFLRAALDRAAALARRSPQPLLQEVEDITGPRMLTRLFFEQRPADVAVLRQIFLMAPRHYPDRWPFNARVHARHHCFGSWKEPPARRGVARAFVERDRWPAPLPRGPLEARLAAPRHSGGSAR